MAPNLKLFELGHFGILTVWMQSALGKHSTSSLEFGCLLRLVLYSEIHLLQWNQATVRGLAWVQEIVS